MQNPLLIHHLAQLVDNVDTMLHTELQHVTQSMSQIINDMSLDPDCRRRAVDQAQDAVYSQLEPAIKYLETFQAAFHGRSDMGDVYTAEYPGTNKPIIIELLSQFGEIFLQLETDSDGLRLTQHNLTGLAQLSEFATHRWPTQESNHIVPDTSETFEQSVEAAGRSGDGETEIDAELQEAMDGLLPPEVE